jgi:hypothetical protein
MTGENGSGWVRAPRALEDHPALQNATRRGLFDRLVLRAARRPAKVNWRSRSVELGTCQLALSVREFAELNELSYKETRNHLARLRQEGLIQDGPILVGANGGASGVALGTMITICEPWASLIWPPAEDETRGASTGAAGAQEGRIEQEDQDSKNVEDSPPSSPPMAADAPPDKPASPQPQAAPPVQPEIRLEVEPEKPPEKPPKRKRRTEGTRLPDDWQLNDNGYAFASGKGLSHDDTIWEADKFRRYFLAAAGQRARKCDWDLTWESWVCRAVEDRGGSAARPGPGRRPSGADRGRGGPTGVMAWTSEVARQEQPMARKVVSW